MTCPRCHGHHWILEPPNGVLIHGTCKGCGYPATWPAVPQVTSRDYHIESTEEKDRRGVRENDLWPGAVGRGREA